MKEYFVSIEDLIIYTLYQKVKISGVNQLCYKEVKTFLKQVQKHMLNLNLGELYVVGDIESINSTTFTLIRFFEFNNGKTGTIRQFLQNKKLSVESKETLFYLTKKCDRNLPKELADILKDLSIGSKMYDRYFM